MILDTKFDFTDCDVKIEANKGVITSPAHPEDYPSDVVCKYEIIVPQNHRVQLKFTDLDIEGMSSINMNSFLYQLLSCSSRYLGVMLILELTRLP